MKLCTGLVFCSLVLAVSSQGMLSYVGRAFAGAKDMTRLNSLLRDPNYPKTDTYFYSPRYYDAARRGPGGVWAAEVTSNAREGIQRVTDRFKYGSSGHGVRDSRTHQAANRWGRSGKDPNRYRPPGLPDKY